MNADNKMRDSKTTAARKHRAVTNCAGGARRYDRSVSCPGHPSQGLARRQTDDKTSWRGYVCPRCGAMEKVDVQPVQGKRKNKILK